MPHSRTDTIRGLFRLDGRSDWKIGVVTVVGTLALIAQDYVDLTPWPTVDDLLVYFLLPMATILLVFRESPREYGLKLGDWRAGIVLTLGAIVIMAPILWLVVRGDPAMRGYYQADMSDLLRGRIALQLFAWEFLFRGFWLFGYSRKFGANAIWLQAVPFALAHLGKPGIETASTIFGGFAFGWIAYRTRSFLYPFAIHLFVTSFTIWLAAGAG
ncbi:MAG: CPBP family intramembrane metalloprotease [Coriobacteriales bacterium]|nr:CPBP family intramembrane metalloprotease [Coriobacteriales bacterium]